MVCVYCGQKTRVTNSRHQVKHNQVWRRRHCLQCGAIFTTEETAEYNLVWLVRRAGHFEPFMRDKLWLSLYECCEHRENPLHDAKSLTDTIIGKLAGAGAILPDTARTIDSRAIARISLVVLNRFDKAAAVRYQSLH